MRATEKKGVALAQPCRLVLAETPRRLALEGHEGERGHGGGFGRGPIAVRSLVFFEPFQAAIQRVLNFVAEGDVLGGRRFDWLDLFRGAERKRRQKDCGEGRNQSVLGN